MERGQCYLSNYEQISPVFRLLGRIHGGNGHAIGGHHEIDILTQVFQTQENMFQRRRRNGGFERHVCGCPVTNM